MEKSGQVKKIIAAILGVLGLVVIFQNVEPTSFDFLFWSFPEVPKMLMLIIAVLFGALLERILLRKRLLPR